MPDDVDTRNAPAKMLNDSGPWDFFISHKQSEAGRAVALITRDLEQRGKKVWLDVNMEDCSTAAMMEGVDHSTFFVCVLSDGYFASEYCRSEALRAQAAGKQIILCHAEGMNVGAALQSKPEGFEQIGQSNSIQLIDSNPRLREVSVQRLLEAAGEETTKAAEERARREREAETTAELEQARAAMKAAQHEVQAEKDKAKAATEKAATEKAAKEIAAKEKAAKVAQVAPAPQQMGRDAAPFELVGWVGYNARFNGTYTATGESRDGRPIFRHVGAGHDWCRMYWAHGYWKIGHFSWVHSQPHLCCAGLGSQAMHPSGIPAHDRWYEHKGTSAGKDYSSDPKDFKPQPGQPMCSCMTWVPHGDSNLHSSGCGFLYCVYPVCPIAEDYHKKGHNKWSHPCGEINFDSPNHGNVCGPCICGEMKRQ